MVDESQNRTHARSREGGGEGGVDLNSKIQNWKSTPRAACPRSSGYSAASNPPFAFEEDNKDEEEEGGKKEEKRDYKKDNRKSPRACSKYVFSTKWRVGQKIFSRPRADASRGRERIWLSPYSQKIIN